MSGRFSFSEEDAPTILDTRNVLNNAIITAVIRNSFLIFFTFLGLFNYYHLMRQPGKRFRTTASDPVKACHEGEQYEGRTCRKTQQIFVICLNKAGEG